MIAPLYHAHHIRHQEDIPFWLELGRRYGDPILELGCGTGRVLFPLFEAGFRVFGLDHDPEMLSWLQKGFCAQFQRPAPVFQADMGGFRLGILFSLILLPCNTLSSLSDEARGRLYRMVAMHLKPGGVFAFSIANPLILRELPRRGESEIEEHVIHPDTGNPVQVSSEWRKTAQVFNLVWHYDHLLPDGRVERVSVETSHTLQPAQAYIQEMQTVGLRVISVWGDFAHGVYTPDSPYWIALAERQAG